MTRVDALDDCSGIVANCYICRPLQPIGGWDGFQRVGVFILRLPLDQCLVSDRFRPKAAAREWRVLTGRCRTRTVAWADREHLLYASTLSKGPTP